MKAIYKWFVGLLVVGIIAGGALLFSANYSIYRVATGSMRPGLPVGSELIVHKTHTDFQKGDVITFHMTPDEIVSHRFIGVDKKTGGLMTKGDANLTADVHFTPLRNSDVVGRVAWHTDVFTLSFWKTTRGVLIIGLLVILGWALFSESDPKVDPDIEDKESEEDQHAGSTPV